MSLPSSKNLRFLSKVGSCHMAEQPEVVRVSLEEEGPAGHHGA